ncbi:MAG: tetratricopeptide repeat protein [Flavobacterium sp.]
MKKLFILVCSVFSVVCFGQSKYELGMQKALQQWQSGQPKEAVAMLDRIAMSDKDNWIPVYYKVFISITGGFNNPKADDIEDIVAANRIVIDQWLDKGGSEWYVLKGMNETLELMTDPMSKGMTQTPIITKAYDKAVELDPTNPRAVFSVASFQIGSAKYMKVDMPYYCKMLEKSIELFDKQKSDVPFYPSWGKDMAVKSLEQCKGK